MVSLFVSGATLNMVDSAIMFFTVNYHCGGCYGNFAETDCFGYS